MKYDACTDCGVEKTGRRNQRCRSCAKKGNTHGAGGKSRTGQTNSLEQRKNLSLARGGDGEIMNRRYPGLGRWTASVKETFACCVVCRSTEDLEAHHIVPKAKYPQYATFIFNGVTLCKPCHRSVHALV